MTSSSSSLSSSSSSSSSSSFAAFSATAATVTVAVAAAIVSVRLSVLGVRPISFVLPDLPPPLTTTRTTTTTTSKTTTTTTLLRTEYDVRPLSAIERIGTDDLIGPECLVVSRRRNRRTIKGDRLRGGDGEYENEDEDEDEVMFASLADGRIVRLEGVEEDSGDKDKNEGMRHEEKEEGNRSQGGRSDENGKAKKEEKKKKKKKTTRLRWTTLVRTGDVDVDEKITSTETTSKSPVVCGKGGPTDETDTESTCGRPLGMILVKRRTVDPDLEFDGHDDDDDEDALVVADAYKGLLLVTDIYHDYGGGGKGEKSDDDDNDGQGKHGANDTSTTTTTTTTRMAYAATEKNGPKMKVLATRPTVGDENDNGTEASSTFRLLNDLAQAPDGSIYMTETSRIFQRRRIFHAAFDGRPSGRLLRYAKAKNKNNISTKMKANTNQRGKGGAGEGNNDNDDGANSAVSVHVVADGLYMPNGIVLSHDSKFMLIVSGVRILRYSLERNEMDAEPFVPVLPGTGDNIVAASQMPFDLKEEMAVRAEERRDDGNNGIGSDGKEEEEGRRKKSKKTLGSTKEEKGRYYWAGLGSRYTQPFSLLKALSERPLLRALLVSILPYKTLVESIPQMTAFAVIDENGTIIRVYRALGDETMIGSDTAVAKKMTTGNYWAPWLSEVEVMGSYLYLASWYNPFLGRVRRSYLETEKL